MNTPLSIVLGPHGQVRALRQGHVRVPGHELAFTDIKRMPDAYREMARHQPYDICEMAPTAYLMALSAGAPLTALPLPMTRRFRHGGVERLASAALRGPQDLDGAQVGVRAYGVTAAVWTRGVFADDYGLDPRHVTWLTEEEENLIHVPLPPNARRLEAGVKLAGLLREGRLQAAFAGLAGAGNEVGVEMVDLVPDADARSADWFRRTGIYPLHGVIVLRNDVIARDPQLPLMLYEAFTEAKHLYLEHLQAGVELDAEDRRYQQLATLVGDPLPYGLAENAASLRALVRYASDQGLIPGQPAIETLFPDPRVAGMPATAQWNL